MEYPYLNGIFVLVPYHEDFIDDDEEYEEEEDYEEKEEKKPEKVQNKEEEEEEYEEKEEEYEESKEKEEEESEEEESEEEEDDITIPVVYNLKNFVFEPSKKVDNRLVLFKEEYYLEQNGYIVYDDYTKYKKTLQLMSGTVLKFNDDEDGWSIDNADQSMERLLESLGAVKRVSKPKKVLDGFSFKLNAKTKNSYILYKKDLTYKLEKTDVKYSDGLSFPKSWKLELAKSQTRPVFFNENYKGWIVSLKYKNELVELGAQNV